MSKAMRQMPQPCGRVSVANGEAERDLASDEASDPPHWCLVLIAAEN